jgi:hypothetical protein
MAKDLQVKILNKTPFRQIGGKSYCIWCCRLSSWTGQPTGLTRNIGLVFSSRVDVKNPTDYPDVPQVQDTTLVTNPDQETQYLYKELPPAATLPRCAEDLFTALRLITGGPDLDEWQLLTRRVPHRRRRRCLGHRPTRSPSSLRRIRGRQLHAASFKSHIGLAAAGSSAPRCGRRCPQVRVCEQSQVAAWRGGDRQKTACLPRQHPGRSAVARVGRRAVFC